jgi:hypothetical protein
MFQRFLPVYTGDGNPQNGLYLAERATTRAADGTSHVVAGWSAAFAAEAHALVGEERKVRLLLARLSWLACGGGVKYQVSGREWVRPAYYPTQRRGA